MQAPSYPVPLTPPLLPFAHDIEIQRARAAEEAACQSSAVTAASVVYEDEWIVAVNKPAGRYCEDVLASVERMLSTGEGNCLGRDQLEMGREQGDSYEKSVGNADVNAERLSKTDSSCNSSIFGDSVSDSVARESCEMEEAGIAPGGRMNQLDSEQLSGHAANSATERCEARCGKNDECATAPPGGIFTLPVGRVHTRPLEAKLAKQKKQDAAGSSGGNMTKAADAAPLAYMVHRLDRDTSGVQIVAKTKAAAAAFMKKFADREVRKTYLALGHGFPPARRAFTLSTGHGRSRHGMFRVYAEDDVGRSLPGRKAARVQAMETRFEVLAEECCRVEASTTACQGEEGTKAAHDVMDCVIQSGQCSDMPEFPEEIVASQKVCGSNCLGNGDAGLGGPCRGDRIGNSAADGVRVSKDRASGGTGKGVVGAHGVGGLPKAKEMGPWVSEDVARLQTSDSQTGSGSGNICFGLDASTTCKCGQRVSEARCTESACVSCPQKGSNGDEKSEFVDEGILRSGLQSWLQEQSEEARSSLLEISRPKDSVAVMSKVEKQSSSEPSAAVRQTSIMSEPPTSIKNPVVINQSSDDERLVLLRCHPVTGRTHQIRLHCLFVGLPLVGDARYGGPLLVGGGEYRAHCLHAESVSMEHPFLDKQLDIRAPKPLWACLGESS